MSHIYKYLFIYFEIFFSDEHTNLLVTYWNILNKLIMNIHIIEILPNLLHFIAKKYLLVGRLFIIIPEK